MPSMQPEQARFLLDVVFLPTLQNEHRITQSVIAAIPHEKGGYSPDNISKSALDLAWHIVVTEIRFLEAIASGAFDLSPRPRPESIKTGDDVNTWYTAQFAPHVEAVAKLSGEQLVRIVDFRGIFQLPAVMYMGFINHHSVHHRGQLSMYLRPMGARVPSIYGESYDATQARLAAQSA